jgi:hypothetical protein
VKLVLQGAVANGGGASPSSVVTANVNGAATLAPAAESVGAAAGGGVTAAVTAAVPSTSLGTVTMTVEGTYTAYITNADAGDLPACNFTVAAGNAVPATQRWRGVATRSPAVRVALEAGVGYHSRVSDWLRGPHWVSSIGVFVHTPY